MNEKLRRLLKINIIKTKLIPFINEKLNTSVSIDDFVLSESDSSGDSPDFNNPVEWIEEFVAKKELPRLFSCMLNSLSEEYQITFYWDNIFVTLGYSKMLKVENWPELWENSSLSGLYLRKKSDRFDSMLIDLCACKDRDLVEIDVRSVDALWAIDAAKKLKNYITEKRLRIDD